MRWLLLVIVALGLTGCAGFLFFPQKPYVLTPDKIGLKYEQVTLTTREGLKLKAWFLPAKGQAKATVLHLHGNAENISTHIGNVYWLPEQDFNVFLLDYRGYGASQGKANLDGVHEDARAALDYLVARKDIPPNKIIVFGQSLGGAIAIFTVAHTTHRDQIKAMVVESSLSDYRKITREKLSSFWLTWPLQWPLSYTMPDLYSPLAVVDKISPIPFLIIHGDNDPIVPLHHGQRLFNAAKEPKQMWLVKGGAHTQATGKQEYRKRLIDYFEEVLKN
ncbi:MAG: alpha/beta fold hydrolase [Gammaproteobacteria bacterium]|nr:alpha/beta fold hydrolase [Gammaproteobacteria bacterium]